MVQKNSVGIVKPKQFTIDEEIALESGRKLGPITVAYETYGKLDAKKSNAVLICHALSGDAHAAGYHSAEDKKPGWWEAMVGPRKGFDTNKYFVICSNVIGGCRGSTGPGSINPKTGKPYGGSFPVITIRDMVNVQKKLIDSLGIKRLLCVSGGSIGGMQVLQWAVSFPCSVKLAILVATAARHTPQQIALHEAGRCAIIADPHWNKGNYYGKAVPAQGLAVARMIGHITYLSGDSMKEKFGRRLQGKEQPDFNFGVEFEVESYLRHKGASFVDRFDANTYLYITRAGDYFDLAGNGKTLEDAFSTVKSKFLIISFTSDWLYPTAHSQEMVRALQRNGLDVAFSEIESNYGHDAFLLENKTQTCLVRNFLNNNYLG